MILYVDGEYIDIYMNEINPSNKFGTIVRVKEEFIRQFMNLIFTGNCDLSKVHFPLRADGSMDYPPPVSATNINNEETENADDSATAKFAKEKPANKGSGFKIIMIAGIALLLGGGTAAFVLKKRK